MSGWTQLATTLGLLSIGILLGIPLGLYLRRFHREQTAWAFAISPRRILILCSGGFLLFCALAIASRDNPGRAISFVAFALLQVIAAVLMIVLARIKFSLWHLMIAVFCVAVYAAFCRWLGTLMIPISGVAGGSLAMAALAYDLWSRWPPSKQRDRE